MKKFLSILFFILLSQTVFCQKPDRIIDSLTHTLSTIGSDTGRIHVLNSLSKRIRLAGDFNKAMNYAKDALQLSEKISFKEGKVSAYNNIGIIYSEQGNYPDALKNLLIALKEAEEKGYKNGVAESYNNIGNVYYKQGNFGEAKKNHLSSLYVSEEINNLHRIANSYGNLGNDYRSENNYSSAINNYLYALEFYEKINDRRGVALSCINIGGLYLSLKSLSEAEKYLSKGLQLSNEIGDKVGVAASYTNIGSIYYESGKLEEAEKYLKKGLQLSIDIGSMDIVKINYLGLSRIDSSRGDYKGAYKYYKLYSGVKDNLLNEESNKQLSQLKIKYETEKKDKEILLLAKNDEIKTIRITRQKTIIILLSGTFFLVVLFALVYFRLYKQKSRAHFKQQILETEMKALRLQMNPHFTFNVLNSIQYFVSENDMESAELYLEKISTLIRLILDQSRSAYISLEQEVNMLRLYLELEEMRFEKKFTYSLALDSNINVSKTLIPGMLIQPIVENAIKHGIEHKEGKAIINISFSLKDSILLCRVTDNGIGRINAEKYKTSNTHKSAATSIIKERMDALSSIYNIKLSYKTEDLIDEEGNPEGTSVTIEIPIGIQNEELIELIG